MVRENIATVPFLIRTNTFLALSIPELLVACLNILTLLRLIGFRIHQQIIILFWIRKTWYHKFRYFSTTWIISSKLSFRCLKSEATYTKYLRLLSRKKVSFAGLIFNCTESIYHLRIFLHVHESVFLIIKNTSFSIVTLLLTLVTSCCCCYRASVIFVYNVWMFVFKLVISQL